MVAHACDPSTWSKGFKFKGSLRKTLRLKAAWVTKPDTVSKQNQKSQTEVRSRARQLPLRPPTQLAPAFGHTAVH